VRVVAKSTTLPATSPQPLAAASTTLLIPFPPPLLPPPLPTSNFPLHLLAVSQLSLQNSCRRRRRRRCSLAVDSLCNPEILSSS